MKKQQFIQVKKTYADKNNLCKTLREVLQETDRLLVDDIHQADCTIREAYIKVTQTYNGKAHIPSLNVRDYVNYRTYWIDDCIFIDVIAVEKPVRVTKF